MKNVKKIVIYAVIIAIAVGSVVIVRVKQSAANKGKPTAAAASITTTVQVQEAKSVEKDSGDTYKATLEACQQGIVGSKSAGKVLNVSIKNGQYVNAGDTLITLDGQDTQNSIKSAQGQLQVYEDQLNTSQVAMEKLKVNLDDAQSNYDRQKALYEKKIIAQTDLEAAEKTLKSAQADYDSGNASIQTATANMESEKITISNLQDTLDNMVIKAPISGVISDMSVNVGQMTSQNTALAKVNDISSVYATIQVPQEKINSVSIGQTATVTVDGSDTTYNGAIENKELSADTTSRIFNCKVKIDNSDKSLLPGIYAKVNLISAEKINIITVPVSALAGSDGDYYVFINNNGVAKRQNVTIGETNQNDIEIKTGVQAGDQIICSNLSTLQDGSQIDAVTKQDDSAKDTVSK